MENSVVEILRGSALGAGCTGAELAALAQRLEPVVLAPGDLLLREGEVADAAFVVIEGRLVIRSADGTELDGEGPGALIGEQALLEGRKGTRSATVQAKTHCRLLRVDGADFDALLAARSERRSRVNIDADAKLRNRLGRRSAPLRALLGVGVPTAWEEGAVVFEEGDAPDGLHLVLAGQAEVVAVTSGGPVHLSTVYPGQIFGEIGVLEERPRTATVVARAGLRTVFVSEGLARGLARDHDELGAFLGALLRSYALRRGLLHQRMVFEGGQACVETTYELEDGRVLTAVRTAGGRYRLDTLGAEPRRTLELAAQTTVRLDGEHRVVSIDDAGQYDEIEGLQGLALDGRPLSVSERRALRKTARSFRLQSPDALVCRCMGLERATIQDAIAAGACSMDQLHEATGCGSVCGGCRPVVAGLLAAAGESVASGGEDGAGTTALTAPPGTSRLPVLPRLVPWLGNFSFGRDPAGFQRRGHDRLGPIFGARLMGADFVFIDPVDHAGVLADVLWAGQPWLDRAGAWSRLVGPLWGDALLSSGSLHADPALGSELQRPAGVAVSAALAPTGETDVVELAHAVVARLLVQRLAGPRSAAEAAQIVAAVRGTEGDDGVLASLLPLRPPALRQRVRAREALVGLVGAECAGGLLSVHHNASMLVVASLCALLDPTGGPAAEGEASQRDLAAAGLDAPTGDALAHLPASVAATGRRLGGGGTWRLATRAGEVGGIGVPEGALVGCVMALAPASVASPAPRGTPGPERTALLDEGLGRRASHPALSERLATLVLAELLRDRDWELRARPRRWTLSLVPGMARPVGGVRAWVG